MNAARKARVQQILDRPSAKPPLVARRADDRHRARRKQGIEAVGLGHERFLAGFAAGSKSTEGVSMYMLGRMTMACAQVISG